MMPPRHLEAAQWQPGAEQVATAARLSTELQAILPGGWQVLALAPGVVREVPLMVVMVVALPAVAAAMEQRSLPGSLTFLLIWATISSVVAAAAVEAAAVEPAALAAVEMAALAALALMARMVWAVVAVVPVAIITKPAAPVEPAAWRFNMPTTTMWPPET